VGVDRIPFLEGEDIEEADLMDDEAIEASGEVTGDSGDAPL
jgi:hypothetical protein